MTESPYTPPQQENILGIARNAVAAALTGQAFAHTPTEDEAYLTEPRGCFVTLHNLSKELRGCIGTFAADSPLIDTLTRMAAAVTKDPRFTAHPVTAAELDQLVIEVSILTPLTPIDDPTQLRLGTDGIYIKAARFGSPVSGCFLPQVATEMGWDVEQTLATCCAHKMGLPHDAWKTDPDMTFAVFQSHILEEPRPVTDYTPPPTFNAACQTVGLQLEPAERDRLAAYLQLLLETNKQFNLTAIKEPAEAWQRHILDSLSLLPFIGEARNLIDIGSGGGLPGIPLACVLPDLPITLVEATGKKARFLATCISELGLGRVEVVTDRAETAGQGVMWRGKYDIAVARAVGPLNVLLELTMPFVRSDGRVLAMKGRRLDEELRDAGDALMILGQGEIEVYEALPGLEQDAVIVEVTKRAPTPKAYPRRPGEPKTNPL